MVTVIAAVTMSPGAIAGTLNTAEVGAAVISTEPVVKLFELTEDLLLKTAPVTPTVAVKTAAPTIAAVTIPLTAKAPDNDENILGNSIATSECRAFAGLFT